jgi:deoxyribose-phosphate aldolase
MNELKKFLGNFNLSVNKDLILQRVNDYLYYEVPADETVSYLKRAVSMVDLTTLEGKDTPEKVKDICNRALYPSAKNPSLPSVAAVCVYPSMVRLAAECLKDSDINVASVATAFPSGQFPLSVKLKDVEQCILDGANEIDMVISRGEFLSGNYIQVYDEIAKVKTVCLSSKSKKKIHLKVILETGELETYANIRLASLIAIFAGADFIKTSTGKINPAANLYVTLVMLDVIKEYYDFSGIKIGMKPAGGLKTYKDTLNYLVMLEDTLGKDWLNNKLFRFGASSVLDSLVNRINTLEKF